MNSKLTQMAWQDHKDALLRYIKSRVSHPADAEDILLRVFEKLLQQLEKKEPGNLVPWLYRVSQNCIADHYRQRSFEALPEDLTEPPEPEPDAIAQLSQCITPMIEQLPEQYASVLKMTELQGTKHKDVAQAMDLSLSAVKSRVLRGKQKLRQGLLDCCAHYTQANTLEFRGNDNCCPPDEKS